MAYSADNKLLLFFPENRLWHFMQIVSILENGLYHFMQIVSKRDNLHEMSKPIFWKIIIKKKNSKNFRLNFLTRVLSINKSAQRLLHTSLVQFCSYTDNRKQCFHTQNYKQMDFLCRWKGSGNVIEWFQAEAEGRATSDSADLTIITLWANSADNKLMFVFLFFPENRIQHFMQGDNLQEMSNPVFWEK